MNKGCSHAKSDGHKKELGAVVGMRQTPVVSRSMAGRPRERAAPRRMLSAAEVGGLLTGCSGPPGFESCLFRSLYLHEGERQTVKCQWTLVAGCLAKLLTAGLIATQHNIQLAPPSH